MRKFLIGLCIVSMLVAHCFALTTSTTTDKTRPLRLGQQLRLITGKINVTASDATAEVTDITKYFSSVLLVLFELSDAGYHFVWDVTNKSIVAHTLYCTAAMITAGSGYTSDQTITDATDIGEANFIAIGLGY